jgi:hypothetical protein
MPEKKETAKKPEEREKRPGRAIEDLPQKEPAREGTERVKGGSRATPGEAELE